jgi:hypothetical protein
MRVSQALCIFVGVVLAGLSSGPAISQSDDHGDAAAIELVDPKVLRVCDDPHNLPFSNEAGEGFENKIATLLAEKLQKPIAYTNSH